MSGALLDINVWPAMTDPGHAAHTAAHEWFGREADNGWASCALTQNGFVRLISNPKYPNAVSPREALALLARGTAVPQHEFWAQT